MLQRVQSLIHDLEDWLVNRFAPNQLAVPVTQRSL